jgi:hypothetical protein
VISLGALASELKGEMKYWLRYKVKSTYNGRWVELTNTTLGPIPYNITVYKSAASANSALSYKFTKFILTNNKSLAFSKFLNDVHSGVEFFFSTMNALPEAPGGFKMIPADLKLPLISHRDWTHTIIKHPHLCKRRRVVHDICIVSSSDLPRLFTVSRNKQWLFHNKYFMEYDHVVIDCLERELLMRNSHEYIQDCQIESVVRQF